tara:strand:+ start:7838 stop:9790 length:1953 start_codon:yes stop_codon:yes gene_type:complete
MKAIQVRTVLLRLMAGVALLFMVGCSGTSISDGSASPGSIDDRAAEAARAEIAAREKAARDAAAKQRQEPQVDDARRRAEIAAREAAHRAQEEKAAQEIPAPIEVRRYPTIEAPSQVAVDASISVMISLTEMLITPEVDVIQGQTDQQGRLKLQLPEQDDKPWEIDVVLSASGFDFSSPNKSKILLPKNGDSSPALFELIARDSEKLDVNRRLYATFWFKGQYLARVQKPISVVRKKPTANRCSPNTTEQSNVEEILGGAEGFHLNEHRSTADLTIYMRRDWDSCSNTDYLITLTSPHIETRHQRIVLAENINEWLIPKFKQFSISGRSAPVADDKIDEDDEEEEFEYVTRDYMVGFGQLLYQQFAPPSFIEAYEELSEKLGDNFTSIQIYTDEPSIPWELMVPKGTDQFLSLTHAMGRWIIPKNPSDFTIPEQSLIANKVYLVTPSYEGNMKLYATASESRFIGELFGQSSENIDAKYSPVKELLLSSNASIIHYSGHGYAQRNDAKNVTDYGLILEDQRLRALNWRGMLYRSQNPSLVFFNACEVGLSETTAGFVDGWSQALTDTGSRGFISALWELGDRGAAQFSKRFYTDLSKQFSEHSEASIADAIRRAKQSFNRSENPTVLAYVFYGDVALKVSMAAKAQAGLQ